MTYKMLAVDDEELMLDYLKHNVPLLNSSWAVAAVAHDGQEALEYIREQSFDLIMTDIKMPVMDGLQLAKEIAGFNPLLKVIIISGYDEFNFAKEAIKLGVCDYLLKPLVKSELQEVLGRVTKWLNLEDRSKAAITPAVPYSDQNDYDIVSKAKEYINRHYSEPISLVLIAEKLNINPSYLSDIFHKNSGEAYIKYLTRIRMEKAAEMLVSSSGSKVADISEKVGYLSVKHFCCVFKNTYNMTPSEYQQKNR